MNIKLEKKEPSFDDIVGVILNYYYVTLISLVIFFVSSVFYVNSLGDSKNKNFSVNALIESASYFIVDEGELQKQHIPFHKDLIVEDELQELYPDSRLSLKELNGKFSPISVSSHISKEYVLEALNGFCSKIVEYQKTHLNHFRNKTKNKLGDINSNIQSTEKTIVSLNQLVDLITKSEATNSKAQDMSEVLTLIEDIESISDQRLNYDVLMELHGFKLKLTDTINQSPNPRLNYDVLMKIHNLELDLIKLKKYKFQLEFMINEENIKEASMTGNSIVKEETRTNYALIVFLASVFGIGIGIIISFVLNLFAVKEKNNI